MTGEPKPVSDAERFKRMMMNFSDFGTWRVRAAAAHGCGQPMVAKLRGKNGHVEVWGGSAHRTEVWFIANDKSETLVAHDCNCVDGSLRLAISTACALAGVQPKLF
jgi:hypothetical protein